MGDDLLRSYISLCLNEAANDIRSSSGLALLLEVSSNHVNAVLFDYEQMAKAIEKKEAEKKPLTEARDLAPYVVACINASAVDNSQFFVVDSVAANKGWGPFIYDVAMSNSPGLMPGRYTVSTSARKVWHYYMTKRNDVEKVSSGPVSKHHVEELDYAYRLRDGGPDTTAMQALCQKLINEIPRASKWIDLAAGRFFGSRPV